MNKRHATLLAAFLMCAFSVHAQNKVFLYPSQAKDTISRNVYGHFAEHLGRCVYDGLYIGDNKKIPNKNGIRLDIVHALKQLKVGVLRWPGGCFADGYHWMDGIGPREKRKHTENVAWGNVREDNGFGTHEFLELCEMIKAEPYLALNMGSGTVQESSDWVKYVNHTNGSSYLTDLRQQNGRNQPWNVRYWGVGNESWDCGGNMTASQYASEYRKYATHITNYGNSEKLFRIAVGPGSEDYNWTETVMRDIPLKLMEGLSIHHYSVINWANKGSATQFSEQEYFRTMEQAWKMDKFVAKNKEIMDKYDPRKKVALVVDEWGGWYEVEPGTNKNFLYQQNTMRDAMIAGLTLNIFHNHADRVRMANLAQIVNVLQAVILTKEEKLVLTPTFHVMEMYNVHQDAVMIPVKVVSDDYTVEGKSIPAVSASASKDAKGNVHISLVNIDAGKEKKISIDIGLLSGKKLSGRILRSDKVQDHNSFEQPDKIQPAAFDKAIINGNTLEITLPPFSVVVLALQ
jgi:alpha-N-arabinofuranosidase